MIKYCSTHIGKVKSTHVFMDMYMYKVASQARISDMNVIISGFSSMNLKIHVNLIKSFTRCFLGLDTRVLSLMQCNVTVMQF